MQKGMYRFLKMLPVVARDKSINDFRSAMDFCHQVSPDKGSSCISDAPQFDGKQLEFDLEVIIPVYNVERLSRNVLTRCWGRLRNSLIM